MDANIRQLIIYASKANDDSSLKALSQAFKSLLQAFSEMKNSDGTDTCGTDLYVLCAEVAYTLKQEKICQKCLQMYFNSVPLTNQFLCRAYLCQAQLLSPKTSDDVVDFETAVVYLLKAINFAKDKSRYHFLVYNASVLYWKISRPFIRPGCRGMLCQSLSQVVKALELIGDKDYEWRALLMLCLVEAYLDEVNNKEASAAALAASHFCANYVPHKFKDVISLQIKHKLIDTNKLSKDIGSVPIFKAFFKLQKIKQALAADKTKVDIASEMKKLLSFVSGKSSTPSLPSSKPSSRDRKSRASADTIVPINESDGLEDLQRVTVNKVDLSEPEMFRPSLLIEIARFCLDIDQVELVKECLGLIRDCNIEEAGKLMEIEFINCELMVKELGNAQESYSKSSVQVRLAAIKRLDQALQNAVRSGAPSTIQGACASQWNLCMPLLQRNLRSHVRSPLTRVAQALEDIKSLQVSLRCRVHIELALCEESVEQIEAALKHLNKALVLDEDGTHRESLQTMLHRLQVSTQLYRTPDRPEDVAAIIIEQARKSPDSGSANMRRSLLIKAGQTLAPDAFQFVLDSESLLKAKSSLKGNISDSQLQAARANLWRKCMKKAPGHLKRLGSENDRERARLWVDLTKTARKQQVWDVCRATATFCLLYDDGRWRASNGATENQSESRRSTRAPSIKDQQNEEQKEGDDQANSDLLRMFAEICFIKGEAFIQFLNDEGLKLNEDVADEPHTVRYADEVNDRLEYADWIREINRQATDAFLRAIELGTELEEQWIVSNGAVYLWNYNQHLIAAAQYKKLLPTFEKVLFGLQNIGHAGIAILLSNICDVIAKALLTPWIPQPVAEGEEKAPTAVKESRKKTGGKAATAAAVVPTSPVLQVSPEASEHLQKALTTCEYALRVTNGSKDLDCIPTHIRHQLLSTWVTLKQMMQQQVAPQYGTDNEKVAAQQAMTKCLVLLETLTLNTNNLAPLTAPSIDEVIEIVEECNWDDPIVELEVWARLTRLAALNKQLELVRRCGEKALQLEKPAIDAGKKMKESRPLSATWGMLSVVCGLLGESLMEVCASNPPARRQALHHFVSSTNYGKSSGDFAVVMSAVRRWWNAVLPLINSPLERELLRPALETLISCITSTSKFARSEEPTTLDQSQRAPDKAEKEIPWVDDLSITAAVYGLLIQTFIDKEDWAAGLSVADRALHHMPRTPHRLLLFKLRVIMKAKLGKNVETDIAKFKNESEDYVANMWHRVAMSSVDNHEQLAAFQKAVEALVSDDMKWQKFEYLLQLATWMYSNEFPASVRAMLVLYDFPMDESMVQQKFYVTEPQLGWRTREKSGLIMHSKNGHPSPQTRRPTDSANIMEWACDNLLSLNFEEKHGEADEKEKKRKDKAGRGSIISPTRSNLKSKAQTVAEPEEKEEAWVCPVVDGKLRVQLCNPKLNINNMKNARQLEGLIRSHVMMAMVHGAGSEQQRVHCQLAYAFVLRLWKISLASVAVALKNMPKSEHAADGGKKTPGTKTVPPTAEKPKRKGPVDALPSSTSEWAQYYVTDEMKEGFQFDKSDAAINKQNFTCAGLTVFYLLELSEALREIGLNHLSLPVLGLAAVITDVLLQSKSWHELVVIKQVQACYELHLEKSARQWENQLRERFLREEEQVKSRQDLELKDIFKELAWREEERIRQAAMEEGALQTSSESLRKSPSESSQSHGRKVGGVFPSEIWTEKARLLLKLGYHQTCRKLLNEALMVSEYENNDTWRADVYHVMAQLAIQERNSGQALQLIRKAQLIGGNELFWKENIYLLVDAITLNQNPSRDDYIKVTKVVECSIGCLDKLLEKRPSKSSTVGHLRASLMAHLCFMHLNSHSSAYKEQLVKLEEAEARLQELGFHRKLASVHLKHSAILRELSRQDASLVHASLLKSISILQSSAMNLTKLCSDALAVEGDKGVSLPVCRELMNVQLHLVATFLDAASVSLSEYWGRRSEEEAKDELQRAVDDYIGGGETFSNTDDAKWEDLRGGFLHQAITILASLHTTLPKQHVLRAEWLYLHGRSLHLVGMSDLPADHQWIFSVPPAENPSAVVNQESVEQLDEDNSSSTLVDARDPTENFALNKQAEKSIRVLAHASESLAQSIGMALQLSEVDLVSRASMELLECTAKYDPTTASNYLFLYQSAEFSKQIQSLLMKSCSDPSLSRFASLIHQESWLKSSLVSTGLHESLVRQHILKSLDRVEAWRRSKVTPQHLSIMKELPPGFNYVTLQPSRDGRWLYCALVCRSKTVVASSDGKGKSKEKFTTTTSPPRVFLTRVEFDQKKHASLLEEFSDFQQQWMSFLLQKEYQNHQIATRKQMLEKLAGPEENSAGNILEAHRDEEARLKRKFLEVLEEVEEFFMPVTTFIRSNLIEPMAAQHANHTADTPADPEHVVILASPSLHCYPLEYLSCFQVDFLASISRDFSLQLLHFRSNEEQDDVIEKKKPEPKSAGKGGKKSANAATKTPKDPPAGSRNIDQNSVHYMVDPCNDTSHTELHPPAKVFRQLLEQHPNNTAKWSGCYGADNIPSFGQFEDVVQQCSMFVYYGTEMFISQFPPSKLASVNLRSSQFVLLLDKAQTHKSFYRQSKVNVDKTSSLLSIEKPIETAMLLSVCGTNAIALNHLHTDSEDNAHKLLTFFDTLIQGKTVGQAAWMLAQQSTDEAEPSADERLVAELPADSDCASPTTAEAVTKKCREPSTHNLILFGLPNLVLA